MAWSSADQNPSMSPSAAYGQTNYAAQLNNAAYYNPMGSGSTMAPTGVVSGSSSIAPSLGVSSAMGGTDYADRLNAATPAPQSVSAALAKGPPRTEAPTRAPDPVAEARAYLASVAKPGTSMQRQGINQAIGRMRPDYVVGLASAVQRAQAEGIPVGPNSSYRDPVHDPGGYANKWNSLHGYGMASDVQGLGGVGSPAAKRFYEIANEAGIYNPYGPNNRDEYNHYQVTDTKGRQFREGNPEAEPALRAYRQAGSPMFSPPNPNMSPRTSPAFGAQGARGPMPNDYPEPTGRGYEPAPELAALWRATGWNGEAGSFDGEPMVANSEGQDVMAGGDVPMPRERPQRTGGASTAYAPAPERMSEEPFRAVINERPAPAAKSAPQGGAYTVKRGDNLSAIAKRELGDANRWREIAQANGIRDPNRIQPGQQLAIPGKTEGPQPAREDANVPQPRMRPAVEFERRKGGAPDAGTVPNPRMRPPAVDPSRYEQTGITPAERNAQRKVGGPVAPMSEMDHSMARVLNARQQDRIGRGMTLPFTAAGGTPETQMSINRSVPTGTPVYGNAAAVNRGAKGDFEGRPAPQPAPVSGVPAATGMDTSGLIREPTPQERALQGQPMPLPTGGQPMDPDVASQIRRTPVVITDPQGGGDVRGARGVADLRGSAAQDQMQPPPSSAPPPGWGLQNDTAQRLDPASIEMGRGQFAPMYEMPTRFYDPNYSRDYTLDSASLQTRPLALPGGPPWVASNGIRFFAVR